MDEDGALAACVRSARPDERGVHAGKSGAPSYMAIRAKFGKFNGGSGVGFRVLLYCRIAVTRPLGGFGQREEDPRNANTNPMDHGPRIPCLALFRPFCSCYFFPPFLGADLFFLCSYLSLPRRAPLCSCLRSAVLDQALSPPLLTSIPGLCNHTSNSKGHPEFSSCKLLRASDDLLLIPMD